MPSNVYTTGSAASKARYSLFTITFILFVICIVISGVAGYRDFTLIDFAIACASGLVMLLYAPIAILLSVRNSSSSFDQAGGEVAYTVMQTVIWLAGSIWALVATPFELCENSDSGFYSTLKNCHAIRIVLVVFSLINLLVYVGWTAWIATIVHRNTSMPRKETYNIPTHRLINGLGLHQTYKSSGTPDLDLENGRQGLFNNRA